MKNKGLSWQIGAAYIGTVIGAGFATGQEILQFFSAYGSIGIITLFLSGFAFSILGYGIFYISLHQETYDYKDFVCKLCGRRLGMFYDGFITTFLFLGAGIMFSGSGAIFKENLHMDPIIGIVVIGVVTLLVVLKSLDGILKANSLIVPTLTTVIILVLVKTLMTGTAEDFINNANTVYTGGVMKPIFYFLFYCSYNTVLSLGVLSAFAETIKDMKVLKRGAIIGGIGLMFLSMFLNICLLLNMPEVFNYSVPMLIISKNMGNLALKAVTICVWFEILSTAIANVFSLSMRLSKKAGTSYKLICIIVTLAAMPLALIDFKKLVAFFYPLFGALSIILIVYILIYFIYLKGKHTVTKRNIYEGVHYEKNRNTNRWGRLPRS